MARKRRLFEASFKARVALDAVRGMKTVSELAALHKVHPSQITAWKKQLLEGAGTLFEGPASKADKSDGPSASELYEQIGRLKIELDWVKRKWPSTVSEKRSWIEVGDAHVSVRRQCELLGLRRSNLYYEAVPESSENLALMRLIDEESLRHPFLGSRRMELYLEKQGHVISRQKVCVQLPRARPASSLRSAAALACGRWGSRDSLRDRAHQFLEGATRSIRTCCAI